MSFGYKLHITNIYLKWDQAGENVIVKLCFYVKNNDTACGLLWQYFSTLQYGSGILRLKIHSRGVALFWKFINCFVLTFHQLCEFAHLWIFCPGWPGQRKPSLENLFGWILVIIVSAKTALCRCEPLLSFPTLHLNGPLKPLKAFPRKFRTESSLN